ncbi:VOC family protein [Telmatobacter sp. DSM 110680]|uniref:VOC family protein n=1 Tax=Telmatobacter sp. DSM 110680 TaxID=3036704 RepID=A0AAU7DDY5_9BACT
MANSNLPERPSLEHLKKLAKTRLQQLRVSDPDAQLATALLHVAREQGYPSWRALKARVDAQPKAKKIVNPVMRFLATANIERSIAFYRDVLGFEVKQHQSGYEATLGPARIEIGKEAFAPGDLNLKNPQPPGSTIMFLQSHDVVATHAAIRARGASPSEIQKVNWIKMRMFEVRDPDGNVVWFGQSYHQGQDSPSRRDAQPHGIRRALPELPFDNVAAAVDYYRDILGFRINYQQDDLGVMDRDAITVLLIARTEQHKGIGSFGTYVSDVDALYAELLARNAHILGEPVSYPWGLRNFCLLDLEGNRITFSQTFE